MAAGFTDRNQQVVAAADLLVAVWTGALGGGTAETIGFAQALGRPVREILLEPAPDAGSAGGRGI
jgi:hypothetical protein